MHLLPRVLILLLLAAAPASADPRAKLLAGVWKGPATAQPNGCVWQVTASVTEKSGFFGGNFTYSGHCGRGVKSGTFNARPSGPNCYAVNAGVPGMPKMQFSACFQGDGEIVLESMLIKGRLKLSDRSSKAQLNASSLLGSVTGTFKKTMSPPGKTGKKAEPNGKPLQPPTLEVHGGGY